MNSKWKLCFPKTFVSRLARINSDHCPLLLSLVPNLGQIGVKPFHFHPVWLNHDGFSNIVKEAWEGDRQNVCHAINMFANKAKIWNKEVFGNIFWKKMNLSARLVGAEKALENAPSQRLINIHNFLLGELENILNLEEKLWGMKARTNRLIQGERNTTFFHISTLNRRSNNQILGIRDLDGNWVTDLERVKMIFVAGFKKLCSSEQIACDRIWDHSLPFDNSLSSSETLYLSNPPSNAEILFALNSMKAFKAPRPDGIHSGFFQRFWMVVGDSVKFEVKRIFQNRKISTQLNKTLIVLIPKQLGLETIGHFRLISLCNTIYKVMSKILVLRMKHPMPKLVPLSQIAFIAGRKGSNNFIVAQELLYTLEKKKGKTGYMIIKIDLEKTYDRMEWSFVRNVLCSLGFHNAIVELILSYISSTFVSLLFNGE